MTFRSALFVGFLAALNACSFAPPKIDLGDSESLVTSASPWRGRFELAAVRIANAAPIPEFSNGIGDLYFPVLAAESASQTLERDLQRYFHAVAKLSSAAPLTLVIKIQRAEAFRTMKAIDRVPFVGIATEGMDREFYIHLKILFEIEERGKVVKTYSYDERITLSDGKNTDVNGSYQRLMRLYRERLFFALDKEFTSRYL